MPSDRVPFVDPHVHHWDHRKTPREPSPLVKLLGWNRRLLNWAAHLAFPAAAVEFFGVPDIVLRNYLPEDYASDVGAITVEGYIHVEAGWKGKDPLAPVDETRWLDSVNAPRLKGIVGFADLNLGADVERVLDAHLAVSGRFRGVRFTLTHHPDARVFNGCKNPNLMRDSKWLEGFSKLAERNLSFDATVYANQLDELAELAEAHPEIPVILCHAGTPTAYGGRFGGQGVTEGERDAIASKWRSSMERLAKQNNVSVKISGLAMPVLGWGYHQRTTPTAEQVATDFQPMVDFVVDCFGAERCMFASNFPIDRVSMPFEALYDVFNRTTAHRSADERNALFHATARRLYRLDT